MVRSMYAGVAGMRAHQYRMDTIGNNISNVNTYGFKSSRATFRDVYYQAVSGAAAPTGNKGGLNPSEVGYGAQIATIDVLHGQSTFTNTGNPFDVAIAGDGFLQVMDADGNVFYTKAGMLGVDSAGNVVDSNGNFVLGVSGDPVGKPADNQKIGINLPALDPAAGSKTELINGVNYTMKASNETDDSNVSFTFLSSSSMPIGEKAKAILTSSGVTVTLNANEYFTDLAAVETAINDAITAANGGKEHPAGRFTLSGDPKPTPPLADAGSGRAQAGWTGAEIVSYDYSTKKGSVPSRADTTVTGVTNPDIFGGVSIVTVGDKFSGSGATKYKMAFEKKVDTPAPGHPDQFKYTVTVGTVTYEGTVTLAQAKSGGSVVLKNGSVDGDTITMQFPSISATLGLATNATATGNDAANPQKTNMQIWLEQIDDGTTLAPAPEGLPTAEILAAGTATKSAPSAALGLGSKAFKLEGGTSGGPQTVKDLSGITIGADGVISAFHPLMDPPNFEIGRIDLVVFDNMSGLVQNGQTYFTTSTNSGEPKIVKAGTSGAGEIKSSALEQSNVDLSQEFSDMITTQRGFQANSRLITVSDTMLEELINLKR